MKKRVGILAALTLTCAAVASAVSAPPPPPPPPPICQSIVFIYSNGTAYECYCNYGTNCTPPSGVPHCTSAQCSTPIEG